MKFNLLRSDDHTVVIHDHTGRVVAKGSFWSWPASDRWLNMMMARLQDNAYAEILGHYEEMLP